MAEVDCGIRHGWRYSVRTRLQWRANHQAQTRYELYRRKFQSPHLGHEEVLGEFDTEDVARAAASDYGP